MCTPTAVIGLQVASGAMGAAGGLMQGSAQKSYYNALAASYGTQAELNNIATQRQIEIDTERAAEQSNLIKKKGAAVFGAQKAQIAASGASLASVSALDLIADSAYKESLDQSMLAHNLESANFEKRRANAINNINLTNQAAQARIAGSNAKTSGYMSAFSSILQTGATVGRSWYDFYGKPKEQGA